MLTTTPFTGDSRQIIAIVLIAVLALGAAGIGYMVWCRRQEEKDAEHKAAMDAEEDDETNEE
jgi:flagellar basal body-associated protein FliL